MRTAVPVLAIIAGAFVCRSLAQGPGICIGASASLPSSECEAWQKFFDSLSGNRWRNCTGTRSDPCACVHWNPYYHPAQLHSNAVSCSGGHIIHMGMGSVDSAGSGIGNHLVGKIPTEIGDFTELTRLSLHTNVISGQIPTELGELTELEGLWLNGNSLTGPIPSEIANLKQLQILDTSQNDLSWPSTQSSIPAVHML